MRLCQLESDSAGLYKKIFMQKLINKKHRLLLFIVKNILNASSLIEFFANNFYYKPENKDNPKHIYNFAHNRPPFFNFIYAEFMPKI